MTMTDAGSIQLLRTSVRARLTTMGDVAYEIVRGDADIVAGDKWFLIYDGEPVPCELEWDITRAPGEIDLLTLRMGAVVGETRLGAVYRQATMGLISRWPTQWATKRWATKT